MDNLKRLYSLILLQFGLKEFSTEDFRKSFHVGNPNLILHRLQERSYLTRVFRGIYRATPPLILILEWAGWRWREKILQKEYLPILEFTVARLIEFFSERLVSIVLFGSIAYGRAGNESDIDLLVVVENLPERYSERLKLLRKALVGLEDLRLKIWREKGRYPLLDTIILTPQEATVSHPFYLDMAEDAIIIYDRGSFMKRKLETLKEKLSELGARKVALPNGRWYWELKESLRRGEVVQL